MKSDSPFLHAYKPIACSYHDELLSLATLKKKCEVQYTDEHDKQITVHDTIADVFTKGTEEFLRLSSGVTIRLDMLVSVNGNILPSYS